MLTSIDANTFPFEVEQETPVLQRKVSVTGKRILDLLVATLVILFILSWMLPLIGLLIKLTSPGPIVFMQWRTGRYGRPFRCYKFRTMRHEPNNITFKQAIYKDSRITRIGSFLRRTNLDEMLQFFNVLQGNMSVVGPRPHAIQHDAEFWLLLPDYHKRYTILPGITGLAQVRGARGLTDHNLKMQHRLRYDLFYIKKCSLFYDLQIYWWTVKAMIKGDKNAW